jgi:hypothetical protein
VVDLMQTSIGLIVKVIGTISRHCFTSTVRIP